MIRIRNATLDASTRALLADYQSAVDAAGIYADQVAEAKRLFSLRNKASNPAFKIVRATLATMCGGTRRCMYCEDSVGDEVEHFKPKDLYPGVVFAWSNYLYACGPCNGPKNSKFSVVAGSAIADVTRRSGDPVTPPRAGRPAVINPRTEDPLGFLGLDLSDTLTFVPSGGPGTIGRLRAEYTIELLALNDRDYLVEARWTATQSYRDMIVMYARRKSDGASASELTQRRKAIAHQPHPTVLHELRRQRSLFPDVDAAFTTAPELL